MKKCDFTLILPCFNEGPTFESSVKKIISTLRRNNCEVIFVEDKSTDGTRAKVKELVQGLKNAKAVFHSRNMGRGRAVADGIKAAKSEICGFIDVDCEISPSYIPLFIKEIKNGSDLVVGKRFYEKGLRSINRVIASKTYANIVKNVLGLPIDDTETGYKFFNKKKILGILPTVSDQRWFWDTEICARSYFGGLKVTQLPVLFVKRHDKKSTVRMIPDSVDYFVKLIQFKNALKQGKA